MDIFITFAKAFIVGGLICTVGQILMQTTKLTSARILVLFVVSGVFLTALGDNLCMGAIEGVQKQGIWGAFTGGITRNAAGIAAAILFGLLNALIFKPKAKE